MSDGILTPERPVNAAHIRFCPPDSKSLLHPASHRPEVAVHLTRVLAQDQADDALSRNCDVLEAAQDVDLLVCQYDACSACVLDGEAGLAVLACDSADGTAQMLALKVLDVFDFCESC